MDAFVVADETRAMTTYRYRGPNDTDPHIVEASACDPYEASPNIYVFVRPTTFDGATYPQSVVSLGVLATDPPQEAD